MREILRSFFKAGVGSGVNMVISLIRIKVLAHYLGPQGVGLVSLLQQFQATAQPIVTLGGDSPLVQGLASRSGFERSAFLASAFSGLLISWSFCAVVIILGGSWFGKLLLSDFGTQQLGSFSLMAIPISAAALAAFLISILTTVGAVGTIQKGQLIGNVGGLIAAIPLALFWHSGNLWLIIAHLSVTPALTTVAAFWFAMKIPSSKEMLKSINFSSFNLLLLRRFLAFGGVTILTGFVTTATWLVIRREVGRAEGLEALGYFSSTVMLSGIPLSLLSTALSSFYLPRFAAATGAERPRLLKSVLLIVLPLAACAFLTMQIMPEIIVKLLFSERFLPMVPLLRWWAAGDFARAISYVFAIPIFAAAHLRFALISELAFSGLLLGCVLFQPIGSRHTFGLGQIYFINYVLYLATVILFARNKRYV